MTTKISAPVPVPAELKSDGETRLLMLRVSEARRGISAARRAADTSAEVAGHRRGGRGTFRPPFAWVWLCAIVRGWHNRWWAYRAECRLLKRRDQFKRGLISEERFMQGWRLDTNPSCRKCNGRGYLGVTTAGETVMCKCARAVYER